ncbi:AMP-binding protein [Micromonospora echinaurantiaca]|uniref:AMP-binding protein n=1 Tax=Micromonospora echinaurantiaca TaxID=47857 RepID=UPI00378FB654
MARLLDELVRDRAGEPALADRHRRLDWWALNDRVNRWLRVLRDRGLSAGDTVAVVVGNRVEVFEALLAGLHGGLRVVPVNWHLTAPELRHILTDSASRAVLVDAPRAGAVAAALRPGECPVRLLVGAAEPPVVAAEAPTVAAEAPAVAAGFTAVEPLLAAADGAEPEGQVCGSVMLYTSGTTGAPKGVVNGVFRQGEPLAGVGRLLAYAGLVLKVPATGRALLVGPWYHSAQLYFALLPLLRGCELRIEERFDPERTLRLIDAESINLCHLVPTQFVRLLRLPEPVRRRFAGGSLRRVWHGGGPCGPEVKRRMIEWWGPVVVEYYAATEGGVVTLIEAEEWLARPGSVGRAVPPTRILVVGPDGAELPPGRVGRIFFRRGAAHEFHYHGDPAKTREAHLAPGVYTYGELGYLDDDGYLFLTGRHSQTIVSGGVNVYPAEVEAALLAHEAVQDVAVLGVPDEEFGERVCALVQLTGQGLAAADAPATLDRHCRTRLAGFKVPRVWRVVDRLPRDETGKLRREALRSLAPRPPATART